MKNVLHPEALKAARNKKGWTQKQLSEKSSPWPLNADCIDFSLKTGDYGSKKIFSSKTNLNGFIGKLSFYFNFF